MSANQDPREVEDIGSLPVWAAFERWNRTLPVPLIKEGMEALVCQQAIKFYQRYTPRLRSVNEAFLEVKNATAAVVNEMAESTRNGMNLTHVQSPSWPRYMIAVKAVEQAIRNAMDEELKERDKNKNVIQVPS